VKSREGLEKKKTGSKKEFSDYQQGQLKTISVSGTISVPIIKARKTSHQPQAYLHKR
jgi:hypothetical protein